MVTRNVSGGLQTADSGPNYGVFDAARLRTLCNYLLNRVIGVVSPAIAIGTTKSQVKVVGAAVCLIGGIPQAAMTAADYALTTGHTSLGNSEACKIAVIGKTGATVETRQGPIVAASVAEASVELPQIPTGWALLGEIYVKTGAAETFVFGTTLLDAGATNATYRTIYFADTGPSALPVTGAA